MSTQLIKLNNLFLYPGSIENGTQLTQLQYALFLPQKGLQEYFDKKSLIPNPQKNSTPAYHLYACRKYFERPFKHLNDSFFLFFSILQLVKTLPFCMPPAEKKTPFEQRASPNSVQYGVSPSGREWRLLNGILAYS